MKRKARARAGTERRTRLQPATNPTTVGTIIHATMLRVMRTMATVLLLLSGREPTRLVARNRQFATEADVQMREQYEYK